jgi:hypothetical protein
MTSGAREFAGAFAPPSLEDDVKFRFRLELGKKGGLFRRERGIRSRRSKVRARSPDGFSRICIYVDEGVSRPARLKKTGKRKTLVKSTNVRPLMNFDEAEALD